jgi:hypothetical protein
MLFPGPNFKTVGGRIQPLTSGPPTDTLLIIGTAMDGPKNTPVRVLDSQQVSRIFGPSKFSNGYTNPVNGLEDGTPSGATIPLAVQQAINAGCQDILVVRSTGAFAFSASAFSSQLNIRSVFPGRIYNNVVVKVIVGSAGPMATNPFGVNITITQPSVKGGSFTTSYASGVLIGTIIDDLNNHRSNSTIVIPRDTWPSALTSVGSALGASFFVPATQWGSGSVTLSGGSDGTNARGELYESSLVGMATELTRTDTGTFDTLLGDRVRFQVCALTGIHLDDVVSDSNPTDTSIAVDYAVWLDNMSIQSMPCIGTIGLRPTGIVDTGTYIDYINNDLLSTSYGYWNQTLRWIKAGPFMHQGFRRYDVDGNIVDIGARLQVCAGPDVIYLHPEVGRYTDNFHVSYAAMLTAIPPEKAPLFSPVPGITGWGVKVPGKYADKLISGVGYSVSENESGRGAYVCLIPSPRLPGAPLAVYEDVTASYREDYFKTSQLVRLCNSIHRDLSTALDGFLGGPSSPAILSAMKSAVKNVMDGYVQTNALRGGEGQGYKYDVTMEGTDQLLGIVRVYIDIWPATAIRRIQFTVMVRQAN